MWGAIGGAVAGALNFVGQKNANKQNLRIAREQMAFQERMSGSAYQRAMRDMKQAGINPMLAFSQGGSSSPGGASATMQNALGPAVSSAQHARRLSAEMRLMGKQTAVADETAYKLQQDRYTSHALEQRYDVETRQLLLSLPALQNQAAWERSLGTRGKAVQNIVRAIFGPGGPVRGR